MKLCAGCSCWSAYGETPTLAVERVGLFTIEVISFVNIGSEIHKEFLYHLCVNPFNGRPVNCVASGKTLSTAKDFNSFLLSSAKVNFEGNANAIRALATQITTTKAPEVRQVPVVGYDPQTKWYVYDSFAIDKSGKHHLADKRGLYSLGANSMIKAAAQAAEKAIKPTSISTKQIKHIHDLFHKAWGDNGIIAFSWVIASWFVNQIKGKENFFPFLSLHGDPAAGKSALTNKLQAIQGRDLEGLPLSQLNTKKGLARTMAGFSGMFTALLEDNQRNERSFDYSILLTAYNTGSLQIQAKFTNTLETQENPFLGALLFVQNNEPFNQKAEKQRVISLHFKTNTLTNNTLQAFKELNEIPKAELAAILVEVLKKRSEIEATWYDEYRTAAADLELVQEDRIRNNHALLLAFHRIFCKLFSISSIDIHGTLEQVATEKELSSAELETNAASIFFHKIFSLKSEQLGKYWHETDMHKTIGRARANRLYFSTVELTRLLTSNNLTPPREEDLERALKEHPAFIRRSVNHYFPDPPKPNTAGPTKIQRKSWKFDLAKFREVESPPEHMSTP